MGAGGRTGRVYSIASRPRLLDLVGWVGAQSESAPPLWRPKSRCLHCPSPSSTHSPQASSLFTRPTQTPQGVTTTDVHFYLAFILHDALEMAVAFPVGVNSRREVGC